MFTAKHISGATWLGFGLREAETVSGRWRWTEFEGGRLRFLPRATAVGGGVQHQCRGRRRSEEGSEGAKTSVHRHSFEELEIGEGSGDWRGVVAWGLGSGEVKGQGSEKLEMGF